MMTTFSPSGHRGHHGHDRSVASFPFLAVTFMLFLVSASSVSAQLECVSDDPNFPADGIGPDDYYKIQPSQSSADNFRISYDRSSKRIRVLTEKGGIDSYTGDPDLNIIQAHFFRQCGSILEPSSADLPDFLVELPVLHVVVTATTQLGYISMLNMDDKIAVYIGSAFYITDPCITERINNGDILVYKTLKDFADKLQGIAETTPEERARLDELLESTQTLVLGPAVQSGMDLPVLDVAAYLEKTVQARMEVLEIYGALFNQEKLARRITYVKEKRYNCISKKIRLKWNDEFFDSRSAKPRICWAYYLADDWVAPYGDNEGWGWVWADRCEPSEDGPENEYYCKMAKEAHIDLVTGDGDQWNENIYSDEESFERFQTCDAIIYPSYFRNLCPDIYPDSMDSNMAEKEVNITTGDIIGPDRKERREAACDMIQRTNAWKDKRVYDPTASGLSNWYQDSGTDYDRVFEDMADIAQRHSKKIKYVRRFLRNVQTDPVVEEEKTCSRVTIVKDDETIETTCNTIAKWQSCHRYRDVCGDSLDCQYQIQCENNNFRIRVETATGRQLKTVRCLSKRVGRKNNKGFSCSKRKVAQQCARKCKECCPYLGE